jgi:hypothetical protein
MLQPYTAAIEQPAYRGPLSQPPNTPLGQMYRRRIQLILERKLKEVLDLYAPDASLVTTTGSEPLIVKGREALEGFFKSRFNIASMSGTYAYWAEVKNALMTTVRATFEFDDGTSITTLLFDNWHLMSGKIATHFVGAVQYPDGSSVDEQVQEVPPTSFGKLYREQLSLMNDANVDALLEHYGPNATRMLAPCGADAGGVIDDRAALRELLVESLKDVATIRTRVHRWAESCRGFMVAHTVSVTRSDGRLERFGQHDTYIIESERIALHCTSVFRRAKGPDASASGGPPAA